MRVRSVRGPTAGYLAVVTSVASALVACVQLLGIRELDEDTADAGDSGSNDSAATEAAPHLDAAITDASSDRDAADASACSGPEQVLTFSAEQDTRLVSATPSSNFGAGGAMGVWSQPDVREALIRFNLSALPFGKGRLTSARLRVPRATFSNGCSQTPVCGDCTVNEAAGEIVIHAARSDWAEDAATWQSAGPQTLWAEAGAGGLGVDRSNLPLAVVQHTIGADVDVVLALPELAKWITLDAGAYSVDGGVVSVLLVAPVTSSVHVNASAREGIVQCPDGGAPGATLTLSYCPFN